jgi:endonuclease/exonuclease/phosphatase family metal-dependent hydrolase
VLNWNIDRGKHLDRILAAIRDSKADLCVFQEVDLGARRTEGKDVAQELAEDAGMNYAFAPEFRELGQSTGDGPAYHGQATLTRLPIRSARLLRFAHQTGFWKPRPLLISGIPMLQRREGGRIALITDLENGSHPVVVYNLHLESKLYEHLRLQQLNEVIADAERYPKETSVIIAGDFNMLIRQSPMIARLREAGYQSAFGDRRVRTHVIAGALDWVFVRGNIELESARVLRDLHASDHDPLSVALHFEKPSSWSPWSGKRIKTTIANAFRQGKITGEEADCGASYGIDWC